MHSWGDIRLHPLTALILDRKPFSTDMTLEGAGQTGQQDDRSCECQVQSLDPALQALGKTQFLPRMPEHQDRKAQIWAGTTAAADSQYVLLQAVVHRGWREEGPGALQSWGVRAVQHRKRGHDIARPWGPLVQPPHSAGLVSVQQSQLLLFWEAVLESPCKECATRYGRRPSAVPPGLGHFLRCGWAQPCSRFLA